MQYSNNLYKLIWKSANNDVFVYNVIKYFTFYGSLGKRKAIELV